ncbi:hypothetical protein QAD02_013990 [Eretmocerus hayati]|uniref:Uncharacterized protein n=1 Tax=Eretmocerus hayati TaxID=131215 RepID=A0ACC2P413_9HYME|nr:hypothetical protein QAD02_013990 [Eretmocerus hayati]
MSTIWSALLEAVQKAKRNGQRYCFVTFDQPLYAKAVEILACLPDDHEVKRMVILREVEVDDLKDLLEKVGDVDFFTDDRPLISLKKKFEEKLLEFKERGPTAQLWVQLIHMQLLLIDYIGAERSGNFPLHLETVFKMLPYFHAAGHIHYAKYAHIYVQTMLQLKDVMKDTPEEYQKFVADGFFTIRRSHEFWCGSWVDFVIEQMLMKNLKGRGGVIQRGICESTLSKWSDTQVAISVMMNGLEEFAGVSYESSEQHKEMRDSRKERDAADLKKVMQFFHEHNPFPFSDEIMSISSNIVGDKKVINCYKA